MASEQLNGAVDAVQKITATGFTVANLALWLTTNINIIAGLLGIVVTTYTFLSLRQRRREEHEEFLRRRERDEIELAMQRERHAKFMASEAKGL